MSRVAFLRPSSAATWIACAGYVAMRAQFPDAPDEADNEVREDGTACHWLAAEVHAGRFHPEGSLSPNGRELTEEMFDAVDEYLGVINAWPGVAPIIEQMLPADCIYPGMNGTPDAWAYNGTTRTIHLADLKFGYRYVEVFECWQLLCYALMILNFLKIDGLQEQYTNVEMTIVQPRSVHRDGPVRTWRAKASDLRALFNVIIGAAHQAMENEAPPCTPNPGCTDCPARHACTALQAASYQAVEMSYAGVPLELDGPALGSELRLLKDAKQRLDARITGLEMQAESMIRTGQVVPGWSIEPTYARERWTNEDQLLALAPYYNVKLAKPTRAITPKQAIKAGLPAEVVAAFSHRPSTGVKLTQIDSRSIRKRLQS